MCAAANVWSYPVAVNLSIWKERALLVAKSAKHLFVQKTGTLKAGTPVTFCVSCDVKTRAKADMDLRIEETTGLRSAAAECTGADRIISTCEVSTLFVASALRLLLITWACVSILQSLVRGQWTVDSCGLHIIRGSHWSSRSNGHWRCTWCMRNWVASFAQHLANAFQGLGFLAVRTELSRLILELRRNLLQRAFARSPEDDDFAGFTWSNGSNSHWCNSWCSC
mmetsp:Transcript_1012/g.1720  ORF Transcript_1012/g.1720 Transcript_1012/m.1720 type:complete len:224 (-) Transcript_1012:495-1166(-)